MTSRHRITVLTHGERDIIITRNFDAPRTIVFETLTRADLLQAWLLSPTGWLMQSSACDARRGGAFRFIWARPEDNRTFGVSGLFQDVEAPFKLIYTETYDILWYPGQSKITQSLSKREGKTGLHMTLSYESVEARDLVLKSEYTKALELSFQRLDELLNQI